MIEMRAVRTRTFQPAITHREIVHVVERDQSLVFALAPFFPFLSGEVVGITVAAVLNDNVVDRHVADSCFLRAEYTNAVAAEIADLHVTDPDASRLSCDVDSADVHTVRPSVVSSGDLAVRQNDVSDVPAGKNRSILLAAFIQHEHGPRHFQVDSRPQLQTCLIDGVDHWRKHEHTAGLGGCVDGPLDLVLIGYRAIRYAAFRQEVRNGQRIATPDSLNLSETDWNENHQSRRKCHGNVVSRSQVSRRVEYPRFHLLPKLPAWEPGELPANG